MNPSRPMVPAVGFLAGFLAVGLPYWTVPYAQANLPDGIIGGGLVVVAVAAMASRAWGAMSILRATLVSGAAAPAAVLARIVVETLQDPTRHNLWPFELVLSGVPGGLAALAGALAGAWLARRAGEA